MCTAYIVELKMGKTTCQHVKEHISIYELNGATTENYTTMKIQLEGPVDTSYTVTIKLQDTKLPPCNHYFY